MLATKVGTELEKLLKCQLMSSGIKLQNVLPQDVRIEYTLHVSSDTQGGRRVFIYPGRTLDGVFVLVHVFGLSTSECVYLLVV